MRHPENFPCPIGADCHGPRSGSASAFSPLIIFVQYKLDQERKYFGAFALEWTLLFPEGVRRAVR